MRPALVLSALVAGALAAVPADLITSLPGWSGALPSNQYSGLVKLYPNSGKNLHYWFVECQNASIAANAPVILWLNGGPGCSSLDGYLYEHGPFHVSETNVSQLYQNPYTWANLAHTIFLEAPAGVGFSYSTNDKDYSTNDTQTADDNFAFLQWFFTSYPEFAGNDFYISGESYAGVYVPTLAQRVVQGNTQGQSDIKLKGILVGNGCTGSEVGICGTNGMAIEKVFLAGHSLMSLEMSAELDKLCGDYNTPSAACLAMYNKMSNAVGNVDVYDIYTPCVNGGNAERAARVAKNPLHSRQRIPAASYPRALGGPDECIDGIAAADWLNDPAVQAALHVTAAMPYVKTWTICSGLLDYTSNEPNLPRDVYPGLVAAGLNILIYNGDVDGCVPYNDNEAWTSGMGYPVASPWHPWLLDNQVAGYATVYTPPTASAKFQFVTVKGSGHMVPQYQPAFALQMLTQFLTGTPF